MKNIIHMIILLICGLCAGVSAADSLSKTVSLSDTAAHSSDVKVQSGTATDITIHVKHDKDDEEADDSYFSIELQKRSGSKLFKKMGKGMLSTGGSGKLASISGGNGRFVLGYGLEFFGLKSSGFDIEIGGRNGVHQVTGTFSLGTGEGSRGTESEFIGGGLEYQNHRLSYNNFVTLAWGLTAGYWYNYYNKYDGFALSYTDTEEYYFGGPLVKLELGFGELPLRIFYKSTLLFGNAVCFRQDYGLYFALTRPAGK
jgi:hypothetical protein